MGLVAPAPRDRRPRQGNLSKSSEKMGEDDSLPMDIAERYEMGLGKEGCSLHVVFIRPGALGIQEQV